MAEETREEKTMKRKYNAGLFIPAGLFLGMGIGWALGYLTAGLFIGLGGGFLLFALAMVFVKD